MNLKSLFTVILSAALISGCATSSEIDENVSLLLSTGHRLHDFSAQSVIFRRVPTPLVLERKFESNVDISVRADVKSYTFNNRFEGASRVNDTKVVVAISGRTGGFAVYDSRGGVLAEHSRGVVIGNSIIFETKGERGSSIIKWYFGEKAIGSVVEGFDINGKVVYSEVTTYRASGY